MKIIDHKLYLTFQEAVECGINARTITDAKDKGTKCWDLIDDPEDRRKVLVGFEMLNDERKRMVEVRFGNPYDRVARMPILNMVVNDVKALDYYMGYRYGGSAGLTMTVQEDSKSLPPNRVYQYTRAAAWLKMLAEVLDNKGIIKKQLKLTVPDFFVHVGELIAVEKGRGKIEGYAGIDVLPGDFPGSYQRVLAKVERYKADGWDGLIDPLYGNKHASKLGNLAIRHENAGGNDLILNENDSEFAVIPAKTAPKVASKGGAFAPELYEQQMAVIRAIAAKAQNLDAGQVTELVNCVFEVNGWKTLSVERIRQIMEENKHLLTAGRRGKKAHMTEVAMQIKRVAPDMAMKYWTLDGWTVELLYQERGSAGFTMTKGKIEYKRLVVVVVLDAFNKYPVGYAIGERETVDLIREANRNALLHVQETLGQMYAPWQIQSDNYQIKNLTPFYQAMAHLHTPAAVGNSKAKVIEPYFKYLNKNYCQLKQNWSGFNVTASKKNQVNTEYLDKVKANFPDKTGVMKQIVQIIEQERELKGEQWIGSFDKVRGSAGLTMTSDGSAGLTMTGDVNPVMGVAEWLGVFGVPLGDKNTITGEGLVKVIGGKKYWYDSFDPAFRGNMHQKWQLIGDAADLSKVLAITEDGRTKLLLEHKRMVPMDVRSASDEDHAYRAQVGAYNKDMVAQITEMYGSDADVARGVIENTPMALNDKTELALKTMFTIRGQQKDGIQDAKGLAVRQAHDDTGGRGRQQIAAAVDLEHEVLEEKRKNREDELVGDFNRYL